MNKINIPESEIELVFSRSSGAGGQNVNKVNSKVTLYWDFINSTCIPYEVKSRFKQKFGHTITDSGKVMIIGQENRSQKDNIDAVFERLYKMIEAVLVAPKKRKKTKPTRSSVEKRLQSKKINSSRKKDRKINY